MPTAAATAKPRAKKVKFTLPADIDAEEVALCGEFNDWSADDIKLERDSKGKWQATVSLRPGEYRYRYLIDGERWENAWTADAYVANPFGAEDSLVVVS
jgi:1,4-alpha-glucan branching enzyme